MFAALTNKTWAIASIYQSPKITDSNFTFSSGYNGKNWAVGDKWHYIKAYKAFKEMYPRISTGSPLDPWRVVRGDIDGTQKTYRFFFCLQLLPEFKRRWPRTWASVCWIGTWWSAGPATSRFKLQSVWSYYNNFTRAKIRYRLSLCWWRTSEECDRLREIFFPPEISAVTWQIYYQGLYGFKSRKSATNPCVLIPWGLQIAKESIKLY